MNPDELFPADLVACDSPRLAWLKKHRILTMHLTDEWLAAFVPEPTYQQIAGSADDTAQWFFEETGANGSSRIGTGETENDALSDLMTTWSARSRGIRLWNEEAG